MINKMYKSYNYKYMLHFIKFVYSSLVYFSFTNCFCSNWEKSGKNVGKYMVNRFISYKAISHFTFFFIPAVPHGFTHIRSNRRKNRKVQSCRQKLRTTKYFGFLFIPYGHHWKIGAMGPSDEYLEQLWKNSIKVQYFMIWIILFFGF